MCLKLFCEIFPCQLSEINSYEEENDKYFDEGEESDGNEEICVSGCEPAMVKMGLKGSYTTMEQNVSISDKITKSRVLNS